MQVKGALGTVVTDLPRPCLLSQYVKGWHENHRHEMQGQVHRRVREVCAGVQCVYCIANACLGYLFYSWALKLASCE